MGWSSLRHVAFPSWWIRDDSAARRYLEPFVVGSQDEHECHHARATRADAPASKGAGQ